MPPKQSPISAAMREIQLTTAFRPGVRLSVPGKKTRVSLPLEFCVKDNGSGVPEDLLPNLFDPFVTTKASGSGLGLALWPKSSATTAASSNASCSRAKPLFACCCRCTAPSNHSIRAIATTFRVRLRLPHRT